MGTWGSIQHGKSFLPIDHYPISTDSIIECSNCPTTTPAIFRYSYTSRLAAFLEYCKTADGITIFFDSSQTRSMFPGYGAHNTETLVRAVTAHGPDGSSFDLMPLVNIPSSVDALGLLGSLSLKELNLRQFCRSGNRWKYIILGLMVSYLDQLHLPHISMDT